MKLTLKNLDDTLYENYLLDKISSILKENGKICCVTVTKPVMDLLFDIQRENIIPTKKVEDIFFIDLASSLNGLVPNVDNYKFLNGVDINNFLGEILKTVKDFGCDFILIDSLPNLLSYYNKMDVLRLVNDLKSSNHANEGEFLLSDSQKNLLEHKSLLEDLQMFANNQI